MDKFVTTLETAKKLKAAGFPQNSVSVWEWTAGIPAGEPYLVQPELMRRYGLWGSQDVKDYAAAPTAQEIADQLREHLYLGLHMQARDNGLEMMLERADGNFSTDPLPMAEAFALLWLKLQNDC
ncbi:hypothetical protein QF038_001820 [Pseudarthrobacter sp. W1I19]|uniref:hypothetical protein n=1 Tax=Pseudarthrobacter sp. W1I19 TaxID=3042288 RepID=UPI00278AA6C6|nr:hypothetical protein [Pseudarthrobacter sp. W1I19]MDQ0923312.1 hypothetical protein [Pseudarthrobacter sp. W1I19]